MSNPRKPKSNFLILDCTIRDGGYLNNWDFDQKTVKEVYRNVSKSGVDYIELGFQNSIKFINPKTEGVWRITTEKLLKETVGGASGAPISLMLDQGKYDLEDIPLKKKSMVSMYRVACHKDKVVDAIEGCQRIKEKGYLSSLQLMGIVGYQQDDFDNFLRRIKKSSIDYVYFADSYGSLFPDSIKKYIEILRETGKRIGFHSHNNLQLAFANALAAIDEGVDILDATIFGMGRGAGNLQLEILITYLEKKIDHKRYNVIPILDLIDRYFVGLKKDLSWGYSLPFMLSGIFEVHPNYSKKLVSYHEYNMDDMIKILEIIKDLNIVGYDSHAIDNIIQRGFLVNKKDSEEISCDGKEYKDILKNYKVRYKNEHGGKDFLILANGPKLKEYKEQIDQFIDKYNPIVMGANYLGGLFTPKYHAFSNKKRFINYIEQVNDESELLLSSSFEKEFIKEHTNRKYESIVHLDRISNCFEIKNGVILSNCRTVSILLVAVAIVMGAKRIFVAGMDGYKNKEDFLEKGIHFYQEAEEPNEFALLVEKHNWNERLLCSINQYLSSKEKEEVQIITPTSHKYFYNSIYNWI